MVGMSDEQDEYDGALAGPDEPSPGNDQEIEKPRRGRVENLKPIQPGEVRNPKGINGRAAREAFVAWAEQTDASLTGGKTRIQAVDEAIFKKAIRGGNQAQKLFVEQYRGRARQHIEVTGDAGNGPPVTFLIPENGRDVPVEPDAPAGDPEPADE